MGLGSGDLGSRHWQQGLSTTRQVTNLVSLSRYKQEILRLRKLVGTVDPWKVGAIPSDKPQHPRTCSH